MQSDVLPPASQSAQCYLLVWKNVWHNRVAV